MFSPRRTLVVLVGLTILGAIALMELVPVMGQPAVQVLRRPGVAIDPDTGEAGEFNHAMEIPTDPGIKRKIQAIQDFIDDSDWTNASEYLQKLLDIKEDVFIQVARKGSDGKETISFISARREAERLLGSMPAKGREHYQLKSGPAAKEKLDKAKEEGDPTKLALVAHHYLYTDAGAEAINLLATYQLDRANYVMAANCFDRLIHRDELDKHPEKIAPITLFKAAIAFHRTDDKANEELAWKHLTAMAGDGLQLGGQKVSLADLKQIKDSEAPLQALKALEWAMYRGGPNRSAQGSGGAPFLEAKGKPVSTVYTDQTRSQITTAVRLLSDKNQPILPSMFPIAVSVRRKEGEEPVPLLIYRSYQGIHALNLKTGTDQWRSTVTMSPDQQPKLTGDSIASYSSGRPGVLFDNSTLGTLSTDNVYVYAIEDLAVAPLYGNQQEAMNFRVRRGLPVQPGSGVPQSSDPECNKLWGYELAKDGYTSWYVGGRSTTVKKDAEKGGSPDAQELMDSFFLGVPLPLGGKLYVLTEKNQELRLVCLDPTKNTVKGENPVVWIQRLGTAQTRLSKDPYRRMQAALLSYGEGILVCPTNAGAVLGVDIMSHSLVWAHPYRDKAQSTAMDPQQMQQMMMLRAQGAIPPEMPSPNDWRVSAPVVQDGKVVFAAPDSSSVQCLNLRDGSLVWKSGKAEDDLYMAGVYSGRVVIVGKKTCRGLSLKDGSVVWTADTGMPSGQGLASDNVYYLPLKAANKTKEPEVCAINVETGVVVAHTKSRKKTGGSMVVPGNLLFHEGFVLSQGVDEVTVFPQLKVVLAQSDELIKNNPLDPVGLTARGKLRLDKGDLTGAIDDLRTALANNPPADTLTEARATLFDSMTELLSRNFNEGEKYLEEYEQLCKVVTPGMTEDQRKAAEQEQERRQVNALCLIARGREQQGKLTEAFDAYAKFGALNNKQELISVIDEPTAKTAADIWARGRLKALVARAKADQLPALEEKLGAEFAKAQKGDLEELRRFVGTFGSLLTTGKEAKLLLAQKLMQENSPSAFLEAELHLLELRHQTENLPLAGQAVETLALLYARKGLMEDASYCYRNILGRDFAKVVIRDGKTGEDMLNEMYTDKRVRGQLDEPEQAWQGRKIKGERQPFAQAAQRWFIFEPEGEVVPFFQHHRLVYDFAFNRFKVIDSMTQKELMFEDMSRSNFQQYAQITDPSNPPRFPYHILGHMVVIPMGNMVYGIDPVSHRKLWEKTIAQGQNVTPDPRFGGAPMVVFPDGFMQKLGQIGPVEASYVCLQSQEGLTAIDPHTGRTLWTRSDVSSRVEVFGDADHIYVIEKSQDNSRAVTSRAFRASDGVTVQLPADFAQLYEKKLRIVGRNLLVADSGPDGMTLRLYDVHTGKDLWKKAFAANSTPLQAEDSRLAGAVEPDGKVTIVDLRTQTELLQTRISRLEDIEKVKSIHVLRDRSMFYLLCNKPSADPGQPQVVWNNGVMAGLAPATGLRYLPINGAIYAFHPDTGKMEWQNEVQNQALVLDQFQQLPILLFAARTLNPVAVGGGRRVMQQGGTFQVVSIQKSSGNRVFNDNTIPSQFNNLNADLRGGKIEFIGFNVKITFTPMKEGEETGKDAAPRGEAAPAGGTGVGTVPAQPVQPRPFTR